MISWIWVILAFMVGTLFGVFLIALCQAAGKADERIEDESRRR